VRVPPRFRALGLLAGVDSELVVCKPASMVVGGLVLVVIVVVVIVALAFGK